MPDPIAALKHDHRSVEKLFERFESTGDTEIALRICQELRLHTALEEDLVYPLIQDRIDDALAAGARDDHSKAKQLVNRVERWRVVDGGLRDLVAELKKIVLEHVEEEEAELFPKMERQIPGDRLSRLGEELAERRPVTLSDVEATIHELKRSVNRLSRRTIRAVVEDLESMTKAELEAYAEESDVADVDQSRQTKEEMIQTIRRGIAN